MRGSLRSSCSWWHQLSLPNGQRYTAHRGGPADPVLLSGYFVLSTVEHFVVMFGSPKVRFSLRRAPLSAEAALQSNMFHRDICTADSALLRRTLRGEYISRDIQSDAAVGSATSSWSASEIYRTPRQPIHLRRKPRGCRRCIPGRPVVWCHGVCRRGRPLLSVINPSPTGRKAVVPEIGAVDIKSGDPLRKQNLFIVR